MKSFTYDRRFLYLDLFLLSKGFYNDTGNTQKSGATRDFAKTNYIKKESEGLMTPETQRVGRQCVSRAGR